jgi:hypothetical protein
LAAGLAAGRLGALSFGLAVTFDWAWPFGTDFVTGRAFAAGEGRDFDLEPLAALEAGFGLTTFFAGLAAERDDFA